MNKLFSLTTLAIAMVSHCAFAWDCWDQCPENEYRLCLEGDRFLSEPVDLSMKEDGLNNQGEPKHSLLKNEAPPTSNLRGSGASSFQQQQQEQDDEHRDLQTKFTYFQFKMYWEPGYCWQAEEHERKWCMECQGDDCDEDDYLWLEKCDENDKEERQQFLYEPLPAFGGGRIKPFHDQSLCWERTRVNAHQLRPCSPLDDLNTTQIVIGFDQNTRFELHPYGWDENSTMHENGPKCINNHHHPKSEELVRAEFCKSARRSKVSRWIVYNPVTLEGGAGSGGGGGTGDPEVNPVGGDYCTPSSPCPQCYGDCDEDDDCAGSLVCFQRDAGDAVPSCSGGEESDSNTDYCIDPNWVPGQGSSAPPTAAPTPSPVTGEPTEGPTSPPTVPPTASPTDPPTLPPETPTASPTDPPTLPPEIPTASPTGPVSTDPLIVVIGADYCTPSNPCPQCYGDCDEDDDCAGDLVCFQRDAGDAVPSCSGGEESDSMTDYCIDPNAVTGQGSSPPPTVAPSQSPVAEEPTEGPTSLPTDPPTASPTDPPTLTPATAEPTTASPTAAAPSPAVPTSVGLPEVMSVSGSFCTPTAPCPICYGDCDVNSDCQSGLVCEQRDGGEMVTGCSGGEDSPSGTDYCVDPDAGTAGRSPVSGVVPSPTPPPVGGGSYPELSYSPSCSPTSPCAKCVGDCDADSDCSGTLICPNRNGGEPVPGCSGSDGSRTDYCVEP